MHRSHFHTVLQRAVAFASNTGAGRRQLCHVRDRRFAISALADNIVAAYIGVQLYCGEQQNKTSKNRYDFRRDHQSRCARDFQIQRAIGSNAYSTGHNLGSEVPPFRAADWNFLLHIPRHQLGRGRMAQSRRASTQNNVLLHCLDTGLYLSFFPQLVAGPITKGKMFFPQIVAKRLRDVEWANATRNIIVGTFLKRVVADNLNPLTLPLTDKRYYAGTPQGDLLAMIIGYSAQIFADFAGYSLIAIGVAQLFGYRLPDNFNQPYLAQSITDFWRRWHMSLSAWLKEYLYIPLGGNRLGPIRTYINLLIVMGLGGLWHGAAWKFAIWGLWHGALLAFERLLGVGETSRGPVVVLRVLLTFSLVTFGWLFFRLSSLADIVPLLSQFGAA